MLLPGICCFIFNPRRTRCNTYTNPRNPDCDRHRNADHHPDHGRAFPYSQHLNRDDYLYPDAHRHCDSHRNIDCLANAIPATNQHLYTDKPAPHSDIYAHKYTHHTDQYVYAEQYTRSSVGHIYIDP